MEPVYDNILIQPEEKTGTLRIEVESQIVGTILAIPKRNYFIHQGTTEYFNLNVGDRVLCTRMTYFLVDNKKIYTVKPYDIVAVLDKVTDGT